MKLERDAASLGTKTKREGEASYTLSPEQRERARELGRKAKEAYEKAEAEERARAKRAGVSDGKPESNVIRLDERRRSRGRPSS